MATFDDGSTVIVVVFVTFGGITFSVLCLFALWCLIEKKKKKKMVDETDIIVTDKHRRVKEAIVQGPHGPRAVVLSVEEDKHSTQTKIIKAEEFKEKELGAADTGDVETGDSSLNPSTH